jgi:hypothetical protein
VPSSGRAAPSPGGAGASGVRQCALPTRPGRRSAFAGIELTPAPPSAGEQGFRPITYGAVDAGEAASLASGEMRVFSDRSRETFGRMEAEPRIDPAASACVCPHSLESRTSGATFATMDGPTRAPSLAGGEQHGPGRDRLEPCSAVIATLHLLATRRPPARQNQPLWCTPQPPCGDRDRPLEREPARTEQAHSAAQPMTPRRAGPTVAPRCLTRTRVRAQRQANGSGRRWGTRSR